MLTCDVVRVTQAEFRRTRSTDNPLHIVGFLSEWKKYLDHHESLVAEFANSTPGESAEAAAETDRKRQAIGQRMDPSVLETVRPLLPFLSVPSCLRRPVLVAPVIPFTLSVRAESYSSSALTCSLPSRLPQLSADQIGQLYELFQASQDVWLSPEELEAKLKAEGKTEEGIPAGQVLPDLGKANRIGGDGGER